MRYILRFVVVLASIAGFMFVGRIAHATPAMALVLGLAVGLATLFALPYLGWGTDRGEENV